MLLGIVVFAVAATFYIIPTIRFYSESKTYARTAIEDIFSTWNQIELAKRATPDFLTEIRTSKFENKFNTNAHKLGAMRHSEITGRIGVVGSPLSHGIAVTGYSANVTFENGSAEIVLFLARQDPEWRIGKMFIDLPEKDTESHPPRKPTPPPQTLQDAGGTLGR